MNVSEIHIDPEMRSRRRSYIISNSSFGGRPSASTPKGTSPQSSEAACPAAGICGVCELKIS